LSGVPFYAKRFVSGVELSEALVHLNHLNLSNISCSLDLLGENVTKIEESESFTNEYITMLNSLVQKNTSLNNHVSLKLTMLGLDVNLEKCKENLYKILAQADTLKIRVCLDMEGSLYTEKTLQIYEEACNKFTSPEIVLQAYLHRTKNDVARVLKANGKFRLCKGAYKEPSTIAYQKMADIVKNYKEIITENIEKLNKICIATHDDEIISFCKNTLREKNISKDKYEFQMLYGMRADTWKNLASEGYPITVYMPYGKDWKAYYSRRLAERKENIFFVLKNLFKK
jgi:proline dehydrogenase